MGPYDRLLIGMDGPEARVNGPLARRIVRPLERMLAEARRDGCSGLDDVAALLGALRVVAQAYAEWASAVSGSARRQSEPVPSSSPRELDTRAAGEVIGITASGVVYLIDHDKLPARKVGRIWLVDEVDAIAYRDRKERT